jgi:hypothetical protein
MQRQEEVSEKEGTWDEKRKIKRNIRINTEVVFASLGTARLMKSLVFHVRRVEIPRARQTHSVSPKVIIKIVSVSMPDSQEADVSFRKTILRPSYFRASLTRQAHVHSRYQQHVRFCEVQHSWLERMAFYYISADGQVFGLMS